MLFECLMFCRAARGADVLWRCMHVVWEQDDLQNLRACKASLHPHHGEARAFWPQPEGSHDYARVLQGAISSLARLSSRLGSGLEKRCLAWNVNYRASLVPSEGTRCAKARVITYRYFRPSYLTRVSNAVRAWCVDLGGRGSTRKGQTDQVKPRVTARHHDHMSSGISI